MINSVTILKHEMEGNKSKKNCGCSSTLRSHLLMLKSPKKGYFLFQWVACEQQTHFRSSLLSLRRPEMRLLFAGYSMTG